MKNSERKKIKKDKHINFLIEEYRKINIEVTLISDDSIREKFYLKNKFYPDFCCYHKYDPKSFKENFIFVYLKEWNSFINDINEYSKIYIFIYGGDVTLFINNPLQISNLFDNNFEYNQNLDLTMGLIIWDSKANNALYIGSDCGVEIYKLMAKK